MKKLCIYHANCADGFGSAWVVKDALGDGVELHAGVHGEGPPDVTDRDVIIVDFSYKRAVIEKMLETARSINIIDHHKSAIEDLANLEHIKLGLHLDLNHSGAMLTWKYFHGDMSPPQLLKHIEDRDLWKFKFDSTIGISAGLFSYPYDFNTWNYFMHDVTGSKLKILEDEGLAIQRKHLKDIHELLGVCKRRINILGHNIPAASLPYTLSSDAGHIMAQGEKFAACYYDTPTGRTFSLRSSEDGMDVSEIAKIFNGGGHKHAAGFSIPLWQAKMFEIRDPKVFGS